VAHDNHLVASQATDQTIEVRGRLSRTEWELVYLAARSFAQAHGFKVEAFELQPAELDADGQVPLAAADAVPD